jgi:hypothetical protein
MTDPNEKKLTEETKLDEFKCGSCGKVTTREAIRKIWNSIPFGNEEEKRYYCGCRGWD